MNLSLWKFFVRFLLLLTITQPGCVQVMTEEDRLKLFDQFLAYQYAPIHYQDTNDDNYKADYITRVDYDGNWNMLDNWDNLDAKKDELPAYAYYSVVESCTHWFVIYGFYHPRDWDTFTHENDMEGLLVFVRKDGSTYGKLEGIVTTAHSDLYSYISPNSTISAGQETIDGELVIQNDDGVMRFLTAQEDQGHALWAYPEVDDFQDVSTQDGIVYYPSLTKAEVPPTGWERKVYYGLIDIFSGDGLYDHQINALLSKDMDTYWEWGTFRGDNGAENGANVPWGWDDTDDGSVYRGEVALDPAHLVDTYFDNLGEFSLVFLRNPYLSKLRDAGFTLQSNIDGWPNELSLDALFTKLPNDCSTPAPHPKPTGQICNANQKCPCALDSEGRCEIDCVSWDSTVVCP